MELTRSETPAASTLARQPLAPWNAWRQAIRATLLLSAREVRTVLRTPAITIPNLIVPIFFYFVMVGSLEEFAGQAGVPNWEAFQLPVAIMFAVQSGSAGLNLVADIESGYFDKLLLTPASRLSILVGAMGADFVRIAAQAALVLVVAMIAGLDFATGVPGMLVLILVTSVWGIAYSAIGFGVALKTGNAQATQSIWVLFIPFMFLTTAFAPQEALTGWLSTAADFNPMTYLLRGMRALSIQGWDMGEIGLGLAAVAGFGVLTMTFALMSLKGRLK